MKKNFVFVVVLVIMSLFLINSEALAASPKKAKKTAAELKAEKDIISVLKEFYEEDDIKMVELYLINDLLKIRKNEKKKENELDLAENILNNQCKILSEMVIESYDLFAKNKTKDEVVKILKEGDDSRASIVFMDKKMETEFIDMLTEIQKNIEKEGDIREKEEGKTLKKLGLDPLEILQDAVFEGCKKSANEESWNLSNR